MSQNTILRLLRRYCELIDSADWDGVGSLFAHGALADERGRVFARGAEQVARFFRDAVITYDGSPRTKHVVADTVQDDDGVVRSVYVVLQRLDDEPWTPIVAGRYEDRFDPDGSGFRFAQRRFVVDLAGDLSRHLRR